ncbi:MAG: hypothetical protein NT062_17590 [Proteobacteria bacterium]|nr:hypothetical protein [Pseudomonadota bacterium]
MQMSQNATDPGYRRFRRPRSPAARNGTGHLPFARLLDTDRDGEITRAEYDVNDLVASLLYADTVIDQGDGERQPVISLGVRVHLTPCAAGRCPTHTPDACFDRARDAAEADVDCGGACGARCQAGTTCGADADCQSNRCATTCAAPTCSDGVRDGLESDVDCGANCAPCAVGLRCAIDLDCTSGRCDGSLGASGGCTP